MFSISCAQIVELEVGGKRNMFSSVIYYLYYGICIHLFCLFIKLKSVIMFFRVYDYCKDLTTAV